MLRFGSGRRMSREVRNEQETTHAGANHYGAAGGRGRSGQRQDGEDGDPGARHERAKEFGGLKVDQARQFKELQKENARLKRAVANLTLDKLILEEAAKGNF